MSSRKCQDVGGGTPDRSRRYSADVLKFANNEQQQYAEKQNAAADNTRPPHLIAYQRERWETDRAIAPSIGRLSGIIPATGRKFYSDSSFDSRMMSRQGGDSSSNLLNRGSSTGMISATGQRLYPDSSLESKVMSKGGSSSNLLNRSDIASPSYHHPQHLHSPGGMIASSLTNSSSIHDHFFNAADAVTLTSSSHDASSNARILRSWREIIQPSNEPHMNNLHSTQQNYDHISKVRFPPHQAREGGSNHFSYSGMLDSSQLLSSPSPQNQQQLTSKSHLNSSLSLNPFSSSTSSHKSNNAWKLCEICKSCAYISERELLTHQAVTCRGISGRQNLNLQTSTRPVSSYPPQHLDSASAFFYPLEGSNTTMLRDRMETSAVGRGHSDHAISSNPFGSVSDLMLQRNGSHHIKQYENRLVQPKSTTINNSSSRGIYIRKREYDAILIDDSVIPPPPQQQRRLLSPTRSGSPDQQHQTNDDHPFTSDSTSTAHAATITTDISTSNNFENSSFHHDLSIPLATPADKDWLIPLHCFIRLYCVEFFTATAHDIFNRPKRRRVSIGQVGIRCTHCRIAYEKHNNSNDTGTDFKWERASICFPNNISSIYNSTMNLLQRHISECNHLPENIRQQYVDLSMEDARSGASKQYWEKSAKSLGLVSTIDGMRICKEVPTTMYMMHPYRQQQQQQLADESNANDIQDNFDGTKFSSTNNTLRSANGNNQTNSTEADPDRYRIGGQPKDDEENDAQGTSLQQQQQENDMDDNWELLVTPEDKKLYTDFAYALLQQMRCCGFTEADRLGKRKNLPLGYTGFACIHCYGGYGSGRYFPSSVKTMADSSKTLNVIHSHMMKCLKCPQNIKDQLEDLRERHDDDRAMKKFGSQKAFFQKIWERLHKEGRNKDSDTSSG